MWQERASRLRLRDAHLRRVAPPASAATVAIPGKGAGRGDLDVHEPAPGPAGDRLETRPGRAQGPSHREDR